MAALATPLITSQAFRRNRLINMTKNDRFGPDAVGINGELILEVNENLLPAILFFRSNSAHSEATPWPL